MGLYTVLYRDLQGGGKENGNYCLGSRVEGFIGEVGSRFLVLGMWGFKVRVLGMWLWGFGL